MKIAPMSLLHRAFHAFLPLASDAAPDPHEWSMAIWTGQPKKRAAFSPCVRGSWKLSPNPKLDVFGNTLGLCLTFKNSDGFGPPRFSQTCPFSSSLMTIGCIFSIFANFIALAFTSDRRFEKKFARDFIALAPSPVTYLLPAFRKNTSVKHIHALAFTSDLSFAFVGAVREDRPED